MATLLIDCLVCKRTIWANAKCLHGEVDLTIRIDDVQEPETNKINKERKKKDRGDGYDYGQCGK